MLASLYLGVFNDKATPTVNISAYKSGVGLLYDQIALTYLLADLWFSLFKQQGICLSLCTGVVIRDRSNHAACLTTQELAANVRSRAILSPIRSQRLGGVK